MTTRTIFHSAIIAILSAGVAVVSLSPAFAQDETPPSIALRTDGVDLSSPAGQLHMQHRIVAAAREVCFMNERDDLHSRSAKQACYRQALAGGTAQLASLQAGNGTAVAVAVTGHPTEIASRK